MKVGDLRTIILLCLLAVPAVAQTPTPPGSVAPVPLPQWFVDIDTAKKGEVSRAEFLKYRMKMFEALDTNKDGKLSLDEFIKLAEPPYAADVPGGDSVEDRRNRARAEFQTLDTNRDGFVERAEVEAVVHSEFNQYDTDRDNKVTEAEVRLIVQRALQRQAAERQQAEAQRRQNLMTLSDLIDMQLREADALDKNGDGKISQQEYLTVAGPADGPQAKDLLPYEVRKQLTLRKFREIDTNKDGVIDRVELTAFALKQFLEMDLDGDRFHNQDELTKAREADAARIKEIIPTLLPASQPQPQPQPRPAPTQPQPAPPAPQGLPQGLPQRTR
jgi:Ca2+-binding EF-hand superfamily protein